MQFLRTFDSFWTMCNIGDFDYSAVARIKYMYKIQYMKNLNSVKIWLRNFSTSDEIQCVQVKHSYSPNFNVDLHISILDQSS